MAADARGAGGRPIIVSALFGDEDFAFLDGLRRAHFPPERNRISAHLTLFHHLPPSAEHEVRRRLTEETRGAPQPRATLTGPLKLGRGTALRVASDELVAIRARLADGFAGLLRPQDQAGFRPHVTIQNKVTPAEANALHEAIAAAWTSRPLAIAGLAVWAYDGGDWAALSRHPFSRSGPRHRS